MSSWIKIRSHLANHPKVLRVACAMKVHPSRVLGCLVYIWSVADMHADGECLPHMTTEVLDQMVDLPGLSDQLIRVDWMRVQDDGLYLPNYQEHNGTNAKRRAEQSKRMCATRAQSVRTDAHDMRTDSHELSRSAHLDKSKSKNKKKKEKENSDSSPVVITFPTDGEVPHWHLRQAKVDRLAELFPKLDVMAEARTALAWIEANPEQRKTANGMDRFFTGWLTRSNNKPKPPAAPTYQTRTAPVVRKWSEVFAQQAGITAAGSGQPLPCLPEVVR
jgi:hypothetical protein